MVDLCARFGLRRSPQVRIADCGTPMLAGALRPVILLPPEVLESASHGEVRLMLAHELAHLKRRDLLWSALSALAHGLFLFHPLVWLAHREHRLAAEIACDELALRATGSRASEYGEMLLKAATACRTPRHLDFSTVGVLESYRTLERRLSAMRSLNSPRRTGWNPAGVLLILVGLIGLAPWHVSAQHEGGADRGERLAEQWEEVLLLEAMRYLRLTPDQLHRLLPLARVADERLTRLRAEEGKTLAALERIARKHREALLAGRRPSAQEQADALFLNKTLQGKKVETEEEILRFVLPHLARILSRDQVQRAHLLAHGETPQGIVRSPALYDPAAGFVLDHESQQQWRTAALRQVLSRRYPPALVQSLLDQMGGFRASYAFAFSPDGPAVLDRQILLEPKVVLERSHGTEVLFVDSSIDLYTGRSLARLPTGNPNFPQALNDAAIRDLNKLQARWTDLSKVVVQGATEDELVMALRPFARRFFLSPRVKPVLEERIRAGGGNLDAE
jgi:BlaR1 peptidase M56